MGSDNIIYKKSLRIPEIDGLRGIAILMVVFFHYINNQLINSTNTMGKLFCKVTQFGWIGVDLFFVLSGFLIGSILLVNKKSKNYFTTFYIRRSVRIIPNYYFLLILFSVIFYSGFFDKSFFLTGNREIPFWSYFAMTHNFFMAKLTNLGNDPLNITWSIAIEEQFYIIFPFILYKLNTKWIPILSLAIILIALYSRMQYDQWIPKYVLLSCRFDSLCLGVMVAWININYEVKVFVLKNKNYLYLSMALITIVCFWFYKEYGDLGVFKHTLFASVFAILIIFALGLKNTSYNKFLQNKWLIWIGTISYSIYLFHDVILGLAYFIFGKYEIGIKDNSDVLISLLAFSFSLFFSYLLYKYLESPMIKIGKKFNY